jgi:hypothetical protein
MTDSISEEGRGEVESNDPHYEDSDSPNNNYNERADNKSNRGIQSIPGEEYGRFYEQYLYSLLPAIYKEYDAKENNILQEFLKIIACPAAALRRDIDGLLNDFFINSCEDWVIPYIGDLIAAKFVPNSSLNSRLDVQNTIHWRKLKGTRIGLEDLIRNTINSNATVKEAFRFCSSNPHLGFSKNIANVIDRSNGSSSNFVNLHDQSSLNDIDSENDTISHLIDVREPSHANGWYNIKNLMLFLPQLNVYHLSQVEAQNEEDDDVDGSKYYCFSNLSSKGSSSSQELSSSSSSISSSTNNRYFPLYDLDTGLRIKPSVFSQDPFHYFGHKRGMAIRINNILAAYPKPSDFSPIKTEIGGNNLLTIASSSSPMVTRKSNGDNPSNGNVDPDFIGLHKEEGIRILEPRKFTKSDKHFIIRVYSYSDEEQDPIEIANYDTSKIYSQPYYHLLLQRSRSRKIPFGTILISVEPLAQSNATTGAIIFPETVIAIRDSQRFPYVREKTMEVDNRISKCKNALYVYLPAISLNYEERKYLFVDTDGSTYYEEKAENDEGYGAERRLRGKLARQACGQVFPARQLTYSLSPLKNFADLNRFNGIKVLDAKKYEKGSSVSPSSFDIEGIAIDKIRSQAWRIGRLHIRSDGTSHYINEKEVWIRWIIQTVDYSMIDKDKDHSFIKEYLICHFKAMRLVLEKDLVVHREEIDPKKIIRDMIPGEILPENAFGNGIATYHIDEERAKGYGNNHDENDNNNNNNSKNSNVYEIDVTVNVNPGYRLDQISDKIRNAIEENPELNNNDNDAELLLSISIDPKQAGKGKSVTRIFPLSEIILTNSIGKSILVYIPQLIFRTHDSKYSLYITSDGSTSFEEDLSISARKSAGQVIPLAGKYPLQNRIPVYMNLAKISWQSSPSSDSSVLHSGELAIDPEHGRFAFSRQDDDDIPGSNDDGQSMRVTADYNYAFSYDIGAGAYDRRDGLMKANKWVSKNGHVHYDDALPSKTFQTIVDALASAEDGDVIQIEDSSIYEESTGINSVTFHATTRNLTLQAANQRLPAITLTKNTKAFRVAFKHQREKLNSEDLNPTITLNGILITGGPLALEGDFGKLVLNSCTIDPGYDDKRFLGVEIKSSLSSSSSSSPSDTYAPTTITTTTEARATTATTTSAIRTSAKKESAPSKEISLNRSISGGIVADKSVSKLSVKDSIIDNLAGSAIRVKKSNKGEEPTLKLEAERSNILGNPQEEPVLELKDICLSDVILTSRVNVIVREKNHDQTEVRNNSNNRGRTSSICRSIRHSRYERGSIFEIIGNNNNDLLGITFRCTSETPIFISTTFGDPAYLHLDHLTSKSILEGAQNTLEMGVFNQNDKPSRMRNLKIRLQEFLPLGVKSGLVYLY